MQTTQSHYKMIFISFIIPVYNTPKELLERCLQSIRALPLEPNQREIIIVDDGSDAPYNVSDAKVIRQEHQGVSQARNEGMKHAQGTYIQFIDADDELALNHYRAVLITLWKKQPDILAFAFNTAHRRPRPWGISSGTHYLRHYNIFGSVCAYTFQRQLIQNYTFNPQLSYGEDEEFTAKVLLDSKRLIVMDRPAYFYHKTKSSVTAQHNAEAIQQRLNDTFAVIRNLDWYLYHLEGAQYKALQRRIRCLACDYLHNTKRLIANKKERKAALEQAREQLRSLSLYPLPLKFYSLRYLLTALRG